MVVLFNSDWITSIVDLFIVRMNKEAIGTESSREKIKIGSGKNKSFHTFRQIIHVQPKKDKVAINPESHKEIDWKQKWMVRGHWRDIGKDKLGKDRSGIYCVKGLTWITEHEKGPEDKPLIKKVRIIK